MLPGPADYGKRLDAITGRTIAILETASQDLIATADQTQALLRSLREERGRVQNLIDQFNLSALMVEAGVAREEAGPIAVLDIEAIRGAMARLDGAIESTRSHLLFLTLAREAVDHAQSASDGADTTSPPALVHDIQMRQATVAAREDERGRLAREMHDGPAQVFANAIFGIEIAEQIARRDPTRVADELAQLRALLRDGVGEMRRFMSELRPAMLTERGLDPTLRRYVADYNRFFGMHVTVDVCSLPDSLSDEQQLAMFRVVQEALQNIRKHAATQDARVTIRTGPGELILSIQDQGIGFNSGASHDPSPGSGAGLPGMRERARLVGADLTIDSEPGQGVAIQFRLPLDGGAHPAPDREQEISR